MAGAVHILSFDKSFLHHHEGWGTISQNIPISSPPLSLQTSFKHWVGHEEKKNRTPLLIAEGDRGEGKDGGLGFYVDGPLEAVAGSF